MCPKKISVELTSVFLLSFFILCFLHLIGALYPGINTWGFCQWSVLNSSLFYLLVIGGGLISIFISFSEKFIYFINNAINFPIKHFKKISKTYYITIGLCFITWMIFIFRVRTLIYGDGRTILNYVSVNENISIFDQYYFQAGAVYFHHYIFIILNYISNLLPEEIFSLTNIVGGIFGFIGIVKVASQLTAKNKVKWFIILSTLSSSSIILFFGYIENYTWANSFGIWSLYFTLLYLNGKGGKFLPILFSLLAMSFHLITVFYFIVTILSMFYDKKKVAFPFSIKFKHINLIAVIGSFVIVGTMQFLKITDIFVPLFSDSNPYMFFSLSHIRDLFNETILVAPLGILFLLITFFIKRISEGKIIVVEQILVTLTILSFLISAWIDPELGYARDWDLLSIYGIPLSLLGAYRFTNLIKNEKHILPMFFPLLIILFVHLVPDIMIKNKPKLAVKHLDNIIWEDAHYQTDYKEALRCLSWGYLLYKYENSPDMAIKYFKRRLSLLNNEFESAYHLGEIYFQKDFFDSSEVYYSLAVKNNPYNVNYLYKLSYIKSKLNKKDEAIEILRRIVNLNPESQNFRYLFAVALFYNKQIDEALENLKIIYNLDNSLMRTLIALGEIYIYLQQYDSAYNYLTKAQIKNPELIDIYPLLINTQNKINKFSEALISWKIYQQLKPNAPELSELYDKIQKGLNVK